MLAASSSYALAPAPTVVKENWHDDFSMAEYRLSFFYTPISDFRIAVLMGRKVTASSPTNLSRPPKGPLEEHYHHTTGDGANDTVASFMPIQYEEVLLFALPAGNADCNP